MLFDPGRVTTYASLTTHPPRHNLKSPHCSAKMQPRSHYWLNPTRLYPDTRITVAIIPFALRLSAFIFDPAWIPNLPTPAPW